MDRNQLIGIILIMTTIMLWTIYTAPSPEEIEAAKQSQDSVALVEQDKKDDSAAELIPLEETAVPAIDDSVMLQQNQLKFGAFYKASAGEEADYVLENELVRFTLSSKGGHIKEVLLKKHYKTVVYSDGKEGRELVKILESPENRFNYVLPVPGALNKTVNTADLYFQASSRGNTVSLKAYAGDNMYFEQRYTLRPDDYTLDYSIHAKGLGKVVSNGTPSIRLEWLSHLQKYEKSEQFEQNYSTVYFKPTDKNRDYCRCVSDAVEELPDKNIEWVSHANQFFNTSLIARETPFSGGIMTTKMTDYKTSQYVKIVTSDVDVPLDNFEDGSFEMVLYSGPNEFKRLEVLGTDLDQIIPFGSSIFGTINRWVIRPFFDFLSQYIGSKGLVIIILIFLIKMALYPLMYKMLYSQAKMGALKPELTQVKEKYKDDMQKQQMETMKMYREYGVSPLGGCLPMVLQMPIWYAMFRFFPASITFRQESFLWATDLSTYDVFFDHGIDIPFMGTHISLFTLLWAVSTIVYTYYNMQNVDLSANPAMKYVQYFMPVMFLGFFNSYAAGLTCYMFFSNLINILQTIITKKFVFDEGKIRAELLKEKAKPKKKSGFAARLEEAMKQQQAQQEMKKNKNKK